SNDVQDLFNSVRRFEFNDYTIYVPIQNLVLEIDSIKVGNVEFARVSATLAQRLSSEPQVSTMITSATKSSDDILKASQKFFGVSCISVVRYKPTITKKRFRLPYRK